MSSHSKKPSRRALLAGAPALARSRPGPRHRDQRACDCRGEGGRRSSVRPHRIASSPGADAVMVAIFIGGIKVLGPGRVPFPGSTRLRVVETRPTSGNRRRKSPAGAGPRLCIVNGLSLPCRRGRAQGG
jgi:hypothetical protein